MREVIALWATKRYFLDARKSLGTGSRGEGKGYFYEGACALERSVVTGVVARFFAVPACSFRRAIPDSDLERTACFAIYLAYTVGATANTGQFGQRAIEQQTN